MRVDHEEYAATSIRQARRAKAPRRRQCQTLGEMWHFSATIHGR